MITKESNVTTCDLVKTDRIFIQIPFDTFEQRLKHTQLIASRSTYHLEQYIKYSLSYNSA